MNPARYNKYEPELKEKALHLHLEEGRALKTLAGEYSLDQGTTTY
jgi:transposase